MFDIQEELKKLPNCPGVYIMHDEKDAIIYVGKAVNLHNRVRSYFRKNIGRGPQIDKMVTLISRFEYIVTDSELEALVLENNLIKEHSPKYNTLLKDDKTYPYIKVTMGESYPRVLFSRQMKKDRSRYFGPYSGAAKVKETIDLINKLYQLRTCNKNLPRDCGNERACLNYHIKQCLAPCQGNITEEEYQAQVKKALDFLNGSYQDTLKDWGRKCRRPQKIWNLRRQQDTGIYITASMKLRPDRKSRTATGRIRISLPWQLTRETLWFRFSLCATESLSAGSIFI